MNAYVFCWASMYAFLAPPPDMVERIMNSNLALCNEWAKMYAPKPQRKVWQEAANDSEFPPLRLVAI